MKPLVTCFFVGFLAVFRFENAKGAGTLSNSETGKNDARSPPSPAALPPGTLAGAQKGSGDTVAGPCGPPLKPAAAPSFPKLQPVEYQFRHPSSGDASQTTTPTAGAAGSAEKLKGESSETAGDISRPYSEATAASPFSALSPDEFLEEESELSDYEETRQKSPSATAPSVAVSAAPRLHLFPQCWETGRVVGDKCSVDGFVAVPPSRHPFWTGDMRSGNQVPFHMHMPSWSALVSQANSEVEARALWPLEILHKLIYKETQNAVMAAERLEAEPGKVRSLLCHLLSVAECLFYAEGLQDLFRNTRYLELAAALQLARNTVEDLLEMLERVFQAGHLETEKTTNTAVTKDLSSQTTKASKGPGRAAKEESSSDYKLGGGAKAQTAKAAGGPSGAGEEERGRSLGAFRPRSNTSKLVGWAGWAKQLKDVATEASERASEALHKNSSLVSDEKMLTLRVHTFRIMELFQSRQKPIALRRTAAGYEDAVRLFRVHVVQAPVICIPSKAHSKHRKQIIKIVAELVESSLAVTTQDAAYPSSICSFARLLTRLSKSIRELIRVKHTVPLTWKEPVQELLAHAYTRLDILLSQRPAFMKALPYQ